MKEQQDLPKLQLGEWEVVQRSKLAEAKPTFAKLSSRSPLKQRVPRTSWKESKIARGFRGIRQRLPEDRDDGEKPVGRVGWQMMVCAVVCLMVLMLQTLNIPAGKQVLEGLDYALRTPMNMSDNLGKLKFVGAWFVRETQVFIQTDSPVAMKIPMDGQVRFVDEENPTAVEITPDSDENVCAAYAGQVFYVGDNEQWGPYVRVQHGHGCDTIYAHVIASVKAGDRLMAGDVLGTVAEGEDLHFEVWRDGGPVDPTPYLTLP